MIPQPYLDKTMPRVTHASVEIIQYAVLKETKLQNSVQYKTILYK